MMMVSDVVGELAPLIRRAAQRELSLLPPEDPVATIERGKGIQAEARRRMEGSLPALVAALLRKEALPPIPP